MDNLKQVIAELKQNQADFQTRLQLIEQSINNVSESDLRKLIQNAREIHEGTVLLSYLAYHTEEAETPTVQVSEPVQYPPQQIEPAPMENTPVQAAPVPEPITEEVMEEVEEETEEDILINAQQEAIQATQEPVSPQIEATPVSEIVEETTTPAIENEKVEEVTQEEEINEAALVEELEKSVNSVIQNHTSDFRLINEQEEDNSIANKLRNSGISDLNSAIGINEKFLFTNELFDGNTENFIQEIQKLNSFGSMDDAKNYLNNLASKRSWDKEAQPFEQLQNLVTRRYI